MERGIDCMKYRKSTHIAGVDVDSIIGEKGECVLTIKDAYYNNNVDVSGNKIDGYFLEFVEDVKPMVVNSTNRKTIADIVKMETNCTARESRKIDNWIGIRIELLFDDNVKMMGKTTGGIRVAPKSPIPNISDEIGMALLNTSKTLNELAANWKSLTAEEKKLPTITALKDKLKTELK